MLVLMLAIYFAPFVDNSSGLELENCWFCCCRSILLLWWGHVSQWNGHSNIRDSLKICVVQWSFLNQFYNKYS
jgi:hypothetical protein